MEEEAREAVVAPALMMVSEVDAVVVVVEVEVAVSTRTTRVEVNSKISEVASAGAMNAVVTIAKKNPSVSTLKKTTKHLLQATNKILGAASDRVHHVRVVKLVETSV